ncbi:hypothetical protein CYLTODRAFT_488733 [Cylindrobasidium torrendii FP15055 ss-10]|uniref:C3H1-type domain-containing protein n=1 Tax=Cylindrobasidium torrendii FP15055 ss-10 TaxID=1314674 RepID=A0A0D7BHS4_9AGAR|nr:hypothetical protein CYLTODRAFT_488733 [Cylindrobasidium torrendii FP15055 ss-10]
MGRTTSLVLYAVLLWHTIAGVVYLTTPCEIPLPTPVYTAAAPATMTRTPTQTMTYKNIISTPTAKLVGLPAATATLTVPLPIDLPKIKPMSIEDASESALLEEIPGNMPTANTAGVTVTDDDDARSIVHTSLDKFHEDFGHTHVTKNITSHALKETIVFGSLFSTWDMGSVRNALVYTAKHFSSPKLADVYGDGQPAHTPNRNVSWLIIYLPVLLSIGFLVVYQPHRHVFLRHEEPQEDCGSVEAPDATAIAPPLLSVEDDKETPSGELPILEPEEPSPPEITTQADITVSSEAATSITPTPSSSTGSLPETATTMDHDAQNAPERVKDVDEVQPFDLNVEQAAEPSVELLFTEVDDDKTSSTQTSEPEQPSTPEIPTQAETTPVYGKFTMSTPSTPLDILSLTGTEATEDSSDLDAQVAPKDNEAPQPCDFKVEEDTMLSVEPLFTNAEVETPIFTESIVSASSLAITSNFSASNSGPSPASSSSLLPSSPRTRIRTCRNWSACGGAHYCKFAHIPARLTSGRTVFFEDEQGNFWDKPMHGECVHSRSLYPPRSPPRQRTIDPSHPSPSPRRQRTTVRTNSNSDAVPAPGAGRADVSSWNDISAPAVGSWGGAGWQKNKNKRGGQEAGAGQIRSAKTSPDFRAV